MKRLSAVLKAVRGPVTLITLGTLFLLDYFCGKPFYRTWPLLLIVYGVLWLFERMAANAGKPGNGGGA
jgi:hypothetical protein